MDLWVREARIFKYGSGTGSNFSDIRGEDEPLSGGGQSSGLMSFLKIGDRAAGAIKSGGTTRRAAKMVTLDLDHPDIEQFINWKVVEETEGRRAGGRLADALPAPQRRRRGDHRGRRRGRRAVRRADRTRPCAKAVARRAPGRRARRLHRARARPRAAGRHRAAHRRVRHRLEGEAYDTVSGQNTNNSVRVTNDFMHAVEGDGEWHLYRPDRAREGAVEGRPAAAGARRSGARAVGPDRRGGLAVRRPRRAVTTPPTSGTPARPTARSARPTRAPSTCSSTTRPATWRR